MPFLAIRGSKRPGFGSLRIYASCVIHPWHQLDSGWLRGVDASAAAALGAGSPPAWGVRAVLVLGSACKRDRAHAQDTTCPIMCSVGLIV